MSRMLAVGLVLFGALAGANAQRPNAPNDEPILRAVREAEALQLLDMDRALGLQERAAIQAQLVRRFWNEEQIERLSFVQDGNASAARQRLDALLTTQISLIDSTCSLTDAQKRKLRLAGRGDIKRLFDHYESVKRKLQLNGNDPQTFPEIRKEIRLLQEASNALFHEDSLLCKSLRNTLNAEQLAGYEALTRDRRAFADVRLLAGHRGEGWRAWVTRMAVSPDGRQVVTVGGDAVRLWDVATGKALRVFGRDHSGYWSVAFSPDGRRIATGSNDHTARIWDAATGKELRRLLGHTEAIWGVAFVPNGRQLITGAWDRSLRLWDVETGKQVRRFLGVCDNIRCLACSPDGKLVAAGHFPDHHQPGILRLWDLEQGKEIRTCRGHTQEISSISFSPDGRILLTSGYDNTVRLWDVNTGREIKRLEGHTNRVEGAAFSSDGRYIVSCGDQNDATVRIWDAARGQQLLCSEKCEGGFLAIALLPDSRYVVTAGKDGLGRLWPWKKLTSAAK